jgi:hypothetical protein
MRVLQAKSEYKKVEMTKIKRHNSFDAYEMKKESYER